MRPRGSHAVRRGSEGSGSAVHHRPDAAFGWLQAHAAAHGFANLPSEPWHWSVDGS